MHVRSEHAKDNNFIYFQLSFRHEVGKQHVTKKGGQRDGVQGLEEEGKMSLYIIWKSRQHKGAGHQNL